MKILVIDVGGTHIKAMATGHKNRLEQTRGRVVKNGLMIWQTGFPTTMFYRFR